jgi:hypothetical protein
MTTIIWVFLAANFSYTFRFLIHGPDTSLAYWWTVDKELRLCLCAAENLSATPSARVSSRRYAFECFRVDSAISIQGFNGQQNI